METVVANVAGAARHAESGGRRWLVAPMTLIVPGVLRGSAGAIYYPPESVAANAAAWDGTPLVVNHPERGGRPVSAREGDYLLRAGVGEVKGAGVGAKGRLRADGWFDRDRLAEVEPRILGELLANRPVELSTGLTMTAEPAPPGSAHNGRPYDRVARDLAPDHVAVFAGRKGACSVADGCGVMVGNALSHRALHERLQALLTARFAPLHDPSRPGEHPPPWLADVFDSYLVFCDPRSGDHYRLGYRTDLRTDSVELAGDPPAEVTLTAVYRPVRNEEPEMKLTPEQRAEISSRLVANCQCEAPWKGATADSLAALSDDTLSAYGEWQRSLAANAAAAAEPAPRGVLFSDGSVRRWDQQANGYVVVTPAPAVPAAPPAPAVPAAAVHNAPPPPPAQPPRGKTAEEWVKETFPGMSLSDAQGAIKYAADLKAQRKADLIGQFTANLAGEELDAVRAQLALLDAEAIEKLLPLAAPPRQPVHNYTGANAPSFGRAGGEDRHLVPAAYDYRANSRK